MELKQIKELMAAMGRTCMKRLAIKKDGFELELEREVNGVCQASDTGFEYSPQSRSDMALRQGNVPLNRSSTDSLPPGFPAAEKEEHIGLHVTSPMVGTYYASPSPDDTVFVKVGDKIEKNTVVCIIEAMKVMNEVKANVAGTVVEILVESGHPVEFGTKLFRINP